METVKIVCKIHGVWKSQKKSHSILRAKRASFTFGGSNSVTRQVTFNKTKTGGKSRNWNIQMRHFWRFSNNVAKQVFLYVIKVMLAHLTPESRDPRTAIYEEKELEREKGKEHNVIKEWWKILGNWLDANGCSWCCECKPFVTKNRCLNVFPIHHFVWYFCHISICLQCLSDCFPKVVLQRKCCAANRERVQDKWFGLTWWPVLLTLTSRSM